MDDIDSRTAFALAGLVSFVAAPGLSAAQARQGFSLDRHRPPPTLEDGLAREFPTTLGHLRVSARLALDYALAPFVLAQGDPVQTVGDVVGHRLVAHVVGAVGLFDRFQASLHIPVTAFQTGDAPAVVGASFPEPGAFAMGDVWIGGSTLAYGEAQGVQLGGALELPIPVGSTDDLSGDGGFGARMRGLFAWVSSPVTLGANLGVAFRPKREYDVVRSGSELLFDGGAEIEVAQGIDAHVEILGSTETGDAFAARESAIEALAGARVEVGGGIVVGAGAGPGLTRAVGVPTVRALVTAGWVTPRPVAAPPPREVEVDIGVPGEYTGDPEGPTLRDRDRDGMSDDADQCPDDPEMTDGVDDEDGCPDRVRVLDNRIRLLRPIDFEAGSSEPLAEGVAVLDELASLLQVREDLRVVRIDAWGDGESREDRALALARARRVRALLIERDVDGSRLQMAVGRGNAPSSGGQIQMAIEERAPRGIVP